MCVCLIDVHVGLIDVCVCVHVCLDAKSYPILCDPMDCSPARLLCLCNVIGKNMGPVVIFFSRAPSPPRAWILISCTGRQTLYCGATREDRGYMWRYIYTWAAESDTTEQLGNKFSLQNVTTLPTSTSTRSVSILPWIILITLAVNSFNRYTAATALTLFPTASLHYVLCSP